jgi:hypothetical protein
MKKALLLALVVAKIDPHCTLYNSPPNRCPAIECKETGMEPCVTDADCAGAISQSCQSTTCQSRCAPTRIEGECCDRSADCATPLLCDFSAGTPGKCFVNPGAGGSFPFDAGANKR